MRNQPRPAVVFDRDGTLASVDWCRPLDRDAGTPHQVASSWKRFHGMMPFDPVVPAVADLLRSVPDGITRFMFSGRAAGDHVGARARLHTHGALLPASERTWAWLVLGDLESGAAQIKITDDRRTSRIVVDRIFGHRGPPQLVVRLLERRHIRRGNKAGAVRMAYR